MKFEIGKTYRVVDEGSFVDFQCGDEFIRKANVFGQKIYRDRDIYFECEAIDPEGDCIAPKAQNNHNEGFRNFFVVATVGELEEGIVEVTGPPEDTKPPESTGKYLIIYEEDGTEIFAGPLNLLILAEGDRVLNLTTNELYQAKVTLQKESK